MLVYSVLCGNWEFFLYILQATLKDHYNGTLLYWQALMYINKGLLYVGRCRYTFWLCETFAHCKERLKLSSTSRCFFAMWIFSDEWYMVEVLWFYLFHNNKSSVYMCVCVHHKIVAHYEISTKWWFLFLLKSFRLSYGMV